MRNVNVVTNLYDTQFHLQGRYFVKLETQEKNKKIQSNLFLLFRKTNASRIKK